MGFFTKIKETIDDRYSKWYAEDIPCVNCHKSIREHHPEIDICPRNDLETSYWPMDGLQYCEWINELRTKTSA